MIRRPSPDSGDDDKTVLKSEPAIATLDDERTVLSGAELLQVNVWDLTGEMTGTFRFSEKCTAGRAMDNDIVIRHEMVSRHHLRVVREEGVWWVYDLSKNGVFIDSVPVHDKAKLHFPTQILLGTSGIRLEVQRPGPAETDRRGDDRPNVDTRSRNLSPEEIRARLLAEKEGDDFGDYTRFVRKLIRDDRTSHGRRYKNFIWSLAVFAAVCIGLITFQQVALSNARKLAIDMFYDIKALEVGLSQADLRLGESARILEEAVQSITHERLRTERERIKAEQEKIAEERRRILLESEKMKGMKARYQQYVNEANALRISFPTAAEYERELIVRVARDFGESELEVPPEFAQEVVKYIRNWQSSSRMQSAIGNMEKNDYASVVIAALQKEGLPLQFVYLPLQESNYDPYAIGPETRHGIAKGAWQLLASTAQEYGLTPGPLADTRLFDDQDPRFDFDQATRAGTKYIKRIYSTEAQASGLLVLASYNYGHTRVRNMIREMPENPRERNFWKFIQQYEIPRETRDYVFYIFSAAVICEDPKHFGFAFKPPLLAAR